MLTAINGFLPPILLAVRSFGMRPTSSSILRRTTRPLRISERKAATLACCPGRFLGKKWRKCSHIVVPNFGEPMAASGYGDSAEHVGRSAISTQEAQHRNQVT